MQKITTIILGCCLLGWGNNLSAQSSTLAGGGNASGTGGSVSYSVGQTFYLVSSGGSHFVTPGVQQAAEITGTLPVTWLTFDAKPVNQQVQLKWATASEVNNALFEIERSADGVTFTKLGDVSGAGNSNNTNAYTYLDKKPLIGTSYYRIKQVDNDGKYSYSEIKVVQIEFTDNQLVIYPNPVQGVLNVKQFSNKNKAVTLFLYDVNGKKVGTKVWNMASGVNQLSWDISHLSSGVYLLSTSEKETGTAKIIKQ